MNAILKKLLKGAAIAAVGAVLTYLTEAVAGIDFGEWTPVVTAGFAIVANALRYLLARWSAAPIVLLAFLSVPSTSHAAGALASDWSWGPTVPFFTVRFDSIGQHGGVHGGMLNAGAGVSLNRNFLPSPDGTVKRLTLGVPIFASFTGGDPSSFSLAAGATLGTYNNVIALGAALKFVDVAPGRLPQGALVGLDRTDVVVLISFGLNLGGGEPRPIAKQSLKSALFGGSSQDPPPAYVKLW